MVIGQKMARKCRKRKKKNILKKKTNYFTSTNNVTSYKSVF